MQNGRLEGVSLLDLLRGILVVVANQVEDLGLHLSQRDMSACSKTLGTIMMHESSYQSACPMVSACDFQLLEAATYHRRNPCVSQTDISLCPPFCRPQQLPCLSMSIRSFKGMFSEGSPTGVYLMVDEENIRPR